MDTKEALERIEEIHKVIESSNQAIFSGERMIVIGLLVALIPVIELLTKHLTFGVDFGTNAGLVIALTHTVFYWALFTFVGRVLPFKKLNRETLHPLIKKAFSIKRPFMFAIFGVVFSLAAIGQYQLIHPVVFVLLGFLFSLYGRFSIPAVSYIAWSYVVVGVAYAYLTKFEVPNLWIYMTIYNGLGYVVMGAALRKEARLHELRA